MRWVILGPGFAVMAVKARPIQKTGRTCSAYWSRFAPLFAHIAMTNLRQRVSAAIFGGKADHRYLMARKLISLFSKFAVARRGYMSLFDGRPPDAHPPDWADLWSLYCMIRKRKPATVLEFGSGCSTIMIAQALADNLAEGSQGHLYSLDATPAPDGINWGQITIDTMPETLTQFSTIKITPVILSKYEGHPVWRYKGIPDVSPDFIYLDGPAKSHTPYKVAADVLDLEPRFGPGFRLLVDGRTKNCMFLDAHLKKRYRKTHRHLMNSTIYDFLGH